jgi:hypothetical protein
VIGPELGETWEKSKIEPSVCGCVCSLVAQSWSSGAAVPAIPAKSPKRSARIMTPTRMLLMRPNGIAAAR